MTLLPLPQPLLKPFPKEKQTNCMHLRDEDPEIKTSSEAVGETSSFRPWSWACPHQSNTNSLLPDTACPVTTCPTHQQVHGCEIHLGNMTTAPLPDTGASQQNRDADWTQRKRMNRRRDEKGNPLQGQAKAWSLRAASSQALTQVSGVVLIHIQALGQLELGKQLCLHSNLSLLLAPTCPEVNRRGSHHHKVSRRLAHCMRGWLHPILEICRVWWGGHSSS